MSSTTVPVSSHKQPRVLACVLCQHRKIKCDRNTPCSNCLKANVTCTPSTPAPARKRRRPNQDLQERLARCEQLLKQYAGGAVPSIGEVRAATAASSSPARSEISESPQLPQLSEDFLEKQPPGKMIQREGGARFIDSQLWTKFYDELQAMRSIIDTEEPEESSVLGTEGLTPENNAEMLFPSDTSPASLENLQPDPVHAFRLWQTFLDRVNPLTKIVHVPTLQPYLIEATTDPTNVPINYQALLFSIYLMATIALLDHECVQMLGMPRDQAMQKFASGTRRALIKADFLRNNDMTMLQALVFFLYALQARHDTHTAWVLSGTVMRIAQKMGYHRDGESLKLTPFETEMRRRIWWQLVLQDAKLSLVSGLNRTYVQDTHDTKQPLNLSDADLFPGSTEPVQAREGPTEMAFCLITNRLARFIISETTMMGFEAAILGPDENNKDASSQTQNISLVEKYRRVIRELEEDLKRVEQRHCDPSAGNAHAAALDIRPLIIQKFHEMLMPMREQPEWGTEIFGPKDNLFKIVLMNNEHNTDMYEQMASYGFLWYVKMHFELDVFAVLTGQLSKRATGSLADRGWRVVEKIYRWQSELYDVSQKQYAAQAQYTLKAWKAREQAIIACGRPVEVPECVARLREIVPSSHESRASTQASVSPPQSGEQQQPMNDMDHFLGGYLDVSALNWDMWGDMPAGDGTSNTQGNSNMAAAGNAFSAAMFGGFALGGFGNMPPMG